MRNHTIPFSDFGKGTHGCEDVRESRAHFTDEEPSKLEPEAPLARRHVAQRITAPANVIPML
jgi:hypothetical protein